MSLLLSTYGKTCCVIITLAALHCRAEVSASKSFEACQTDSSFNVVRNLFNGRRYRSRVSQSEPISASYECHMKCVENCNCLSYNICNGGKLCELNPEKKENNISLYETSDTCDYYELSFNQKQSSDCKDQCCSTSKPCHNNGRCEATCMKNGRRFLCDCAEGQDGDQCESVARDCGFYANSANKTHGLRVIYAPDNTAYRAFCYFGNNVLTLAMSFSVENQRLVSAPLSNDQPVFEDSHNWEEYRLGLARMTALRDGAYKWKYACAYDQLAIKDTDSVTIFLAKLDPLKVDGIVCSAAQSITIYGDTCPKCVVAMAQGLNALHMAYHYVENCPSAIQVLREKSCPTKGIYYYYGNYDPDCLDENFLCTSSLKATTQLWFVH